MTFHNMSVIFVAIALLTTTLCSALNNSSIQFSLTNSTFVFDVNQGASEAVVLDRQLISLSIEFCYIVDFLGDVGMPNNFSYQLLENIVDRSGVPPLIRLGGDTQDRATFCADCPDTILNTFVPGNSEAVAVTFNPGLFKVLDDNLGPKQAYIFGLNLGNGSYTVAKNEVHAAMKYMNASKIAAFELGNEPNWYTVQGYRSSNWSVIEYADEIVPWLRSLRDEIGVGFPGYQFGSMSDPPITILDWTEVQLDVMGVQQLSGSIKYISSHAYPLSICGSTTTVSLSYFLNHLNTINYFSEWENEIAVAKSLGVPFHMGETGSVGCHGEDGVSNTLGTLLWEIDYALFAATQGIQRLFFHNGPDDWYYSMWAPLANGSVPAHINPTYYSMLFAADLVSALANPRVYRVSHLDTYDLAHYSIYDGARLARLVIINFDSYDPTSSQQRTDHYVDVSKTLGQKVYVRRLTGPSTNATEGVSWIGQQIDASGLILGELNVESVANGIIRMRASEAVIIDTAD